MRAEVHTRLPSMGLMRINGVKCGAQAAQTLQYTHNWLDFFRVLSYLREWPDRLVCGLTRSSPAGNYCTVYN